MRSNGRHIEGDYYNRYDVIQSPEITSTTHISHFYPNIILPHKIQARKSYRNRPSLSNIYVDKICRYFTFNTDGENVISTKTSLLYLLVIFLVSLSLLGLVYNSFPELTEEEKIHFKYPWNFEDAKNLGSVLIKYKDDHFWQVYFGVSITYIFLQTFAIPGSIFLSVLSGYLFDFVPALSLVCTCSAIGASLCFMISQLVGRRLIIKYFPDKAREWSITVHKQKDNLLYYVIFLRVTPFLPNWFINLTAPVIGVPLWPFAFGTFLGVAPPSFIALQAGNTLQEMSSSDNPVSWTSLALLIVFGFVSLIPIYYKDKLKTKFE